VARQRDADDRLGRGPRLQPGDLDVLEAVECESWLPGLLALAVADVSVRDAGLTEVGRVDRPIRVEPLREPQSDRTARVAPDLEPDDAGKVLAHVQHIGLRFGLGDRAGLQLGEGAYRRTGMPRDDGPKLGAEVDLVPTAIVEARRVPAGHRLAGVVGL